MSPNLKPLWNPYFMQDKSTIHNPYLLYNIINKYLVIPLPCPVSQELLKGVGILTVFIFVFLGPSTEWQIKLALRNYSRNNGMKQKFISEF